MPVELDLQTLVDRELAGSAIEEGLRKYQLRQALMMAGGTVRAGALSDDEREGRSVPFELFMERHPEYDSDLWAELRALYAGGPRLLRNKGLMKRLFPKHRNEAPEVYRERCDRAFYFPYAGTIVDHLVAGLGSDPLTIEPSSNAEGEDAPPLDEWWKDFLEDVSPPEGKRQSAQRLMMEVVREALICRRSWILVDLPQTPEDGVTIDSVLAQEKAGLLDPYAVRVEAEYVIDWQKDNNGELEWVLICDSEQRRNSLRDKRGLVTNTYTFYDRVGWVQYRITYDPKEPPKPETPVAFLAEGPHSFNKVPFVCVEIPEGLWAMGKLESLAREHFNKRCATAWAEYKSLFAILYEFLGPEDDVGTMPVSAAQEDENRALSQVRGQGYSQVRGKDDDARFIGPDVAPFKESRESAAQIMQEMFRVMYSMALSADMDSKALNRSGDSKKADEAVTRVVLAALGVYGREGLHDVKVLVERARGKELDAKVCGAENFSDVDVKAAIEEAVEVLNGLPMKSHTFLQKYLIKVYTLLLGGELTENDRAAIREEVTEMVTAESILMAESVAMQGLERMGEGEEEDDDEDEDEPPPRAEQRRQVAQGQRSVFSSR